jgi:hypothetical protein
MSSEVTCLEGLPGGTRGIMAKKYLYKRTKAQASKIRFNKLVVFVNHLSQNDDKMKLVRYGHHVEAGNELFLQLVFGKSLLCFFCFKCAASRDNYSETCPTCHVIHAAAHAAAHVEANTTVPNVSIRPRHRHFHKGLTCARWLGSMRCIPSSGVLVPEIDYTVGPSIPSSTAMPTAPEHLNTIAGACQDHSTKN